ncbi:MAG TPA: EAL domain-containing protein [Gammaproteobacteria bacterium]|nr:EAL domain-containing protein [Gammaproteobacteria bacterium]
MESDKKGQHFEANLCHGLPEVLVRASDALDLIHQALALFCDLTGIPIARVTYRDPRSDISPLLALVNANQVESDASGELCRVLGIPEYAGLSQEVRDTGRPVIQKDLASVADAGAGELVAAGVGAAFACPLHINGKVAGVLEFYLTRDLDPAGLATQGAQLCRLLAPIVELKIRSHEAHLFRSILDATSDLMAIVDENFNYQAVNRYILEGLQRPSDQVVGHSIYELVKHEYLDNVARPRLERALQGETITFQHWINFAGYGPTCQDIKYSPYRDPAGRVAGVVVNSRDITQRKLAEDELKRNEQRLKRAQQIARLGFWESDLNRDEMYFSDDVYAIYGIAPGTFASNKDAYLALVHPEDRERVTQTIQSSLAEHRPYQIEHRIVRPDGGIRHVYVQSDVYRDPSDDVMRRFGIIMDITDRKQAEVGLIDSETRLRKAQNIARMGFWEVDYIRNSLYISDEMFAIYGLDRETFDGTLDGVLAKVYPADRERVEHFRKTIIQEARPFSLEYRILQGDDIRHIHVQAEFVLDAEGVPQRLLGTIQDITDRKQSQLAVSRSNRALQVVNECNHAIVFASSGQEMENEICRLLVAIGGYRFAWVGYAAEDEYKTVYPVAHAGHASGYLENTFSWSAGSRKFDPVTDAIITGQPYIVNDIADSTEYEYLRGTALERAFRAEIALPLRAGDKAFGALMIYASETDAFDEEEKDLLAGLAEELAFGIHSMYLNSERERAEALLRVNENKYRLLYDENPAMFFTIDTEGTILSVNKFGAEELGYKVDDLVGTSIFNLSTGQGRDKTREVMQRWLAEPGRVHRLEQQKVRHNGTLMWVKETARVVRGNDGEMNVFIVCEDITETRKLSEQLSYQATHDSLTGLINRGEFEKRLSKLLRSTQIEDGKHALCYMDLDQFKSLNDTCGHMAGDELLRQLGMVLLEHIRKRDTVARLGGDEFGVLMEHCPLHRAEYIAKKLMRAVSEFQFIWEGKVYKIAASMGLVPINMFAGNQIEVMKNADAACYTAKKSGRNRLHIFGEDDSGFSRDTSERRWLTRIQDALDADRFRLVFQPIVSLQETVSRHAGYEVLIRMETEEGRLAAPDIFLPVAEYYNLSHQIDLLVVTKLFNLLDSAPAYFQSTRFAVNLSGNSLGDGELLEYINDRIDRTKFSPANLCFEITETIAIANLTSAKRFINILRERGCRFSLDDFGSGLSSFAYLKNLDIDYLKIDGSFIRDLRESSINVTIVKSMHEIGKALGKQTVAESVEDEQTLTIVRNMGFDFAQGNLLGELRSVEQLVADVKDNIVPFIRRN